MQICGSMRKCVCMCVYLYVRACVRTHVFLCMYAYGSKGKTRSTKVRYTNQHAVSTQTRDHHVAITSEGDFDALTN